MQLVCVCEVYVQEHSMLTDLALWTPLGSLLRFPMLRVLFAVQCTWHSGSFECVVMHLVASEGTVCCLRFWRAVFEHSQYLGSSAVARACRA